MARLTRLALIAAALLCVSAPAQAAPVFAAVVGFFKTITVLQALSLAFTVFQFVGASSARKKQRRAAAAAKAAYNASLQDRNVTILSAEAPRQVVYGSPAPIGGAVVAVLTSGTRDEYKHVILVLAAHPSESVDEVYFEGEACGMATRDGSNWMTASPFAVTTPTAISESVTFSGGGTATLSQVPVATVSQRYGGGGPEAEGWASDVTITAGNTTATGPAGVNVLVTYTYNVTTSYLRITPHLSPAGVDTADAGLIADVPAKWTTNHKLSGYTYLAITMNLNLDRFQGGSLGFSVKMKGKLVYDPRLAMNWFARSQEFDNAAWTKGDGFVSANAVLAPDNTLTAETFTAQSPSLTFNFLNATLASSGELPATITFTRSGATATRVNASGLIEAVAADTPRFDYDPVTLACKGLLIEEARTNLIGDTDFDAGWGGSVLPITDPQNVAGGRLEWVAQIYPQYGYTIAVVSGTTYTFSIRFKHDSVGVTFGLVSNAGNLALNSNLVSTGDWQTHTVTATASGTGNANFLVVPNNSGDTTTSGCLVSQPQAEAGAFKTSFIPAVSGAAVTRNADVATVSDISGFYSATEGSAVVEATTSPRSAATSVHEVVWSLNNATDDERIGTLRLAGTPTSLEAFIMDGAVMQANFNGTLAPSTTFRSSLTWKLNDFAHSFGGATVTTDGAGTLPTPTRLQFGANWTGNYFNGHLRRFAYIPARATNAELETVSDPSEAAFTPNAPGALVHRLYQAGGVALNVQAEYSMFVRRAVGSGNFALQLTDSGGNYCYVTYYLGTGIADGVASGAAVLASSGMTHYGNGWYRCWLIGTADPGSGAQVACYGYTVNSGGGNNYVADGLPSVYVWGAQIAPGAALTAYAATTTAGRTTVGANAYSRNPALHVGDFIRSAEGFSATLAQLDSAAWIAAANACDVASYTSENKTGLSTAHYTSDGVIRTDQDREGSLQAIEDAMAGATHQSGGVWRIMAGAWSTPALALTDADSAGPIQITQASYSASARWNGVRGQYIDGIRLGVPEDFKPYSNATFLAADGVARVDDKNYPFTSAIQRCRHLARVHVERSRGGLTIQYPAHMRAWPLQPGDRVSVTNAEFGWTAKTFRVTDWAFSVNSPVGLEMEEDVEAVWDLADSVVLDALPNTGLPDPWVVEALASLVAASGTAELLVLSDGSIVSRVRLTWTQAVGRYVNQGGSVRVRWKRVTQTADIWTDVAVPGDSTTVTIDGVDDKVGYIFAARFEANVAGLVAVGAWTYLDHYVLGKSQPPAAPTGLGYTAEPFGVRLYCAKNAEPDMGGYRWRVGASWGGGAELVNLSLVTNYLWAVQTAGAYTVWVAAVDTSGNESTPTSMAVTVATGSVSGLVAQFVGADLRLDWTGVAGSFAIGTYEVRYGAVFSSATVVGEYNVTRFIRKVDWANSLRWWVAPRDVNRNLGTEQSVEVVVTVPGAVTATRSEVVDHNVNVFWSAPATGSLPIERYEVRVGATWAGGTVVGNNANSTFFTKFEQQSGSYTYWVAAYDTAGNIGTPVGIVSTVNQPPDYILRTDFNSTLNGTKSNLFLEAGVLIGPANIAESWATHYSNAKVSAMALGAGGTGYAVGDTFRLNTGTATEHATGTVLTLSGSAVATFRQTYLGNYTVNPSSPGATTALTGGGTGLTITPTMVGPWATPQDQIDAGYPLYIQPGVCQATYDETYDYGATLAATVLTATLNTTAIVGTVTVGCQIYYKLLIGDAWTAAAAGALSALVTNFRYVRVVWTLTAASGAHLLQINAFNLKLANKLVTDSGSFNITVAADGHTVPFAVAFVYADTPIAQANGDNQFAEVDFTNVPNPTGATYRIRDRSTGSYLTGSGSWTARGY